MGAGEIGEQGRAEAIARLWPEPIKLAMSIKPTEQSGQLATGPNGQAWTDWPTVKS